MCGRINLRTNPRDWAEVFAVVRQLEGEWQPSYNLAPTQQAVCVRDREGEPREFFRAKWGLIPPWAKDLKFGASCINARVESVASKPAFRSAFKKKRCLVLADGFHEWRKPDKQPFFISMKSGPMPFAGLWEVWKSPDDVWIESCSVITTEANELMEKLHDRMPVILPQHAVDHWLDPAVSDPDELMPMLTQFAPDEMQAWPVGKEVGNVRNQGPQLMEPVGAAI